MMFRSKRLLQSANGQQCQNCGSYEGVVCAHSNLGEHGKGGHCKAHDLFTAHLCHSCHSWLDQGGVGRDPTDIYDPTYEDKREMFMRAMHKTWLRLMLDGFLVVR